ncbi:activated RNA polymerase II transcriptional coactivator p15-like [Varroa jacobsoni]|uniref:Transcriptional coactivator p15 (PC4) C-terminal domain-containing protein n=1 Tax=Varroa destructor TaxID=109461 RepID=A0A7M7J9K9_VARDE|nr:activated RNA polymerase II transcriptional coactivator p15-like [Varroa destructor]XP_022648730.1 activated RNA polymerase II transcriptional coactivator p15-like [Varroa destructor]XP_022648731.1 activated RNA polymerase II transcriptional coactivator p15-like [Varroa destructor]XP_022703480.1 activated RNA polymerase II transcriptional coactivator p15-like [Varroa jacobsoni]XP_022703481.1 activated RNA polymerase II transcriptional coactivator p15-like [Varroa jacobsoni]XP_022703482.1 ac
MPKPSKKDLSDSDSGPEDRNPVPTKKRKSDAEDTFELSKMRQVSVSDFKGKLFVNIREYYEDSNGETRPGKKGIALSIDQWEKLKEHMVDIDKAIKAKS